MEVGHFKGVDVSEACLCKWIRKQPEVKDVVLCFVCNLSNSVWQVLINVWANDIAVSGAVLQRQNPHSSEHVFYIPFLNVVIIGLINKREPCHVDETALS